MSKKIIYILTLVTLFFTLTKPISAQEINCQISSISPNPAVSGQDPPEAQINCVGLAEAGVPTSEIPLFIRNSANQIVGGGSVTTLELYSNSWKFVIGGIVIPGTYTLELGRIRGVGLFDSKPFVVLPPESGPVLAPNCGDPVGDYRSSTCNIEAGIIQNCCPSFCPPAFNDELGQFVCTLGVDYVCSANAYGGGGDDSAGINSAIGCIPFVKTEYTASFFLKWGLALLGGIVFLVLIYGSYIITTSAGDSRKLQSGKELITAAISALLFLIFSIFILRLIGVQILNIF